MRVEDGLMAASDMVSGYHADLYKYWNAARGARATPTRSDFDPIGLVRILPFIGLVERRQEGYFWRLIGTAIVEHFGQDLTGERYGAHFSPPAFVAATTATFDLALEREVPFFDAFVYRSLRGSIHAVSRLACPLAADAAHPPMVIHTRIHRYCRGGPSVPALADQTWGELQNRWPISSLDEVHLLTEKWLDQVSADPDVDALTTR